MTTPALGIQEGSLLGIECCDTRDYLSLGSSIRPVVTPSALGIQEGSLED